MSDNENEDKVVEEMLKDLDIDNYLHGYQPSWLSYMCMQLYRRGWRKS